MSGQHMASCVIVTGEPGLMTLGCPACEAHWPRECSAECRDGKHVPVESSDQQPDDKEKK